MDQPFLLELAPFLAIGVLICLGLWILWRQRQAHAGMEEVLERLAREHRGEFVPGGDTSRPEANFEHQGLAVTLGVQFISTGAGKRNVEEHTRLILPWNGPPIHLVVGEEGWLETLGKVVGVPDIELGEADFDARFLIQSDEPALARKVLSRDARDAIVALQAIDGGRSLRIEIEPGHLRILKHERMSDYDSYVTLLRYGVALARAGEAK